MFENVRFEGECLFFMILEYIGHSNSLSEDLVNMFGDACNQNGQSLLHLACSSCEVKAAELLVKFKPYLQSMRDNNCQLPLHIASSKDHFQNVIDLVDLVSKECDIDNCDNDGNSPLHIACSSQNWQVISFLVNYRKPSLILKNKKGFIPLFDILRYRIMPNCIHLIKHNDVNLKDGNGNTLLHIACTCYNNISLIRTLIMDFHASINETNSTGDLPLILFLKHYQTIELEAIKLLCNYSTINMADSEGNTLLHIVCINLWKWKKNVDMYHKVLRYLVCELNGSIKARDAKGNLPHHLIILSLWQLPLTKSIIEILDLFINSDTVNAQNDSGDTALHILCRDKHFTRRHELVEYFISKKNATTSIINSKGKMPIHVHLSHSLSSNDSKVLIDMLLKNTDVNVPDSDGNTPLHLACKFHHPETVIIHLIKSQGALISVQNNCCELPLHLILQRGCKNLYIINLLITLSNLSVQNEQGYTPLHLAWQKEFFGDKDISSALALIPIAIGVNFSTASNIHNSFTSIKIRKDAFTLLSIQNKEGSTPLQVLVDHASISSIRYFRTVFSLDHPRYSQILCSKLKLHSFLYKLKLKCPTSKASPLKYHHSMRCISEGCTCKPEYYVSITDHNGQTILHAACQHHDFSFLHAITISSETVNSQDYSGKTPLHIACDSLYFLDTEIFYIYDQPGCIHNIKDNEGNLPVHYYCARKGCKYDALPILIADLHTFNEDGLSPVHVAIKSNHLKTARYLLKRHNQMCEEKLNCRIIREKFLDILFKTMTDQEIYYRKEVMEKDGHATLILSGITLLKEFAEFKQAQFNLYNSYPDLTREMHIFMTVQLLGITTEMLLFLTKCACQLQFIEIELFEPFKDTLIDRVTLMHAAAWNGCTELLQYLIVQEKCNPNSTDKDGYNTLWYACRYNPRHYTYELCLPGTQRSKSSILLLIDSGCSIFSKCEVIGTSSTLTLFESVCHRKDLELLKILTSSHDVVNSQDDSENTPLMILLKTQGERKPLKTQGEREHDLTFLMDAMKYLIQELVCNQEIADYAGCTALHFACKYKLPFEVIKIMDYSTILRNKSNSVTLLTLALKNDNFATFEEFINEVFLDDCEKSMLFNKAVSPTSIRMLMKYISIEVIISVLCNENQDRYLPSTDLLKFSIEHAHEYDINVNYTTGSIPVDTAGNSLLHKACEVNSSETVKKLKKSLTEESLQSRNNNGDTPLHVACHCNSFECIELMPGLKLNGQNSLGNTPLHICCLQKNWRLLEYLLTSEQFIDRESALCTQNDCTDYPLSVAIRTSTDWPAPFIMLKFTTFSETHSSIFSPEKNRLW